jgi:uncharacterized membrane protein (DUF4010 family)
MDVSIAYHLGLALALGLIVGFERGWNVRESAEGSRSAGLRTFAVVGLFGGISALLGAELGAAVLAVAFLSVAAMVVASYWLTASETKDLGATTEFALLATFVLGALVMRGFETESLAGAVILAAILGFKQELHHSLERVSRSELRATLQLLLIAAVALPLLPDRDLGPWQALNPRTIGLLVLLIAGISYVGWFSILWLGSRAGSLLTAALGGLTSSTAVAVAFGRMAKRSPRSSRLLAAGIVLAAGMMGPRLLMEVALVNRALAERIAVPVLMLALVPFVAAPWMARTRGRTELEVGIDLRNPLELRSAMLFGVLLTALFLAVHAVQAWLGDAGIYGLAALSGLADVDALALSLAGSSGRSVAEPVAVRAILLAAWVNTASKAALATVVGGWSLGRHCIAVLAAALLASLAASGWLGL